MICGFLLSLQGHFPVFTHPPLPDISIPLAEHCAGSPEQLHIANYADARDRSSCPATKCLLLFSLNRLALQSNPNQLLAAKHPSEEWEIRPESRARS